LDLDRIISELERERDRISRAIALLENESKNGIRKAAVPMKAATSKSLSGGLTPAGRKRLSEAMKKRWAERSGSTGTSGKTAAPVITATQEKKRGGITTAGRKRLSQAMKKRWAERRKKGR
jgi:hypothetical protein